MQSSKEKMKNHKSLDLLFQIHNSRNNQLQEFCQQDDCDSIVAVGVILVFRSSHQNT